ncbi:hypothetical protein NKH18_35445 [Streptomyces sp. M10(2022)]
MRKTLTATACVLTAALLTGCGGGEEKPAEASKGAARRPGVREAEGDRRRFREGRGLARGDDQGRGRVGARSCTPSTTRTTRRWTCRGRRRPPLPAGAENEVGRLVLVGPGTMTAADGKLVAAGCSITVDGKTVIKNDGGETGKPCSYKLK